MSDAVSSFLLLPWCDGSSSFLLQCQGQDRAESLSTLNGSDSREVAFQRPTSASGSCLADAAPRSNPPRQPVRPLPLHTKGSEYFLLWSRGFCDLVVEAVPVLSCPDLVQLSLFEKLPAL